MKIKKLLVFIIIMVLSVADLFAFALFFGRVKVPSVTEKEFDFTITYEYQGETHTLEQTVACHFSGADADLGEQIRFWEADVKDNEKSSMFVLWEEGNEALGILYNFHGGYLMGDPLFDDSYDDDYAYRPYAIYYDEEGVSTKDEAVLNSYGLKVLSWEYPDPIQNKFKFSHFDQLTGSMVIPMTLLAVASLVACILFVKRDKSLVYGQLDNLSFIFNILIGVIAVPFLTIACSLVDINGDGSDPICQILYCVPAFTVLCIGASLSLRRKGFSKSGLITQFAGPAVFVLCMVLDYIIQMTSSF